jgi:RNA ligase (TIGR02306 family)
MGYWDDEKSKGTLVGSNGNRVKAIKLRGFLSQGICCPLIKTELPAETTYQIEYVSNGCNIRVAVHEGDSVEKLLGIIKYEPVIPLSMSGEVFNIGTEYTVNFDVENFKSYPNVLVEGEDVIFTEKIHGTFCGVRVLPKGMTHPEAFGKNKNILIYSKGLGGGKGLVFKNNESNTNNIYVRATASFIEGVEDVLGDQYEDFSITFMGEVFGPNVQDLTYGKTLGFRVFAATYHTPEIKYISWDELTSLSDKFKFEKVPVLYRGPFSVAVMKEHTDGQTTFDAKHIREGIVMTPTTERHDYTIGRVSLKSVSEAYLVRKNGTEYN